MLNAEQSRRWNSTEIGRKYIKKYNKKYREKNKDRIEKLRNDWLKTPNGRIYSSNCTHTRNARKRGNGGVVSNKELKKLLDEANVCLSCGVEFTEDVIKNIDHIFPISRGGRHEIENLQVLCRTCNFRKGDRI